MFCERLGLKFLSTPFSNLIKVVVFFIGSRSTRVGAGVSHATCACRPTLNFSEIQVLLICVFETCYLILIEQVIQTYLR